MDQTRELNNSAFLEYIRKVDFMSPTGTGLFLITRAMRREGMTS